MSFSLLSNRVLCALLVIGCAAARPSQPQELYPAPIKGFEQYDKFPAETSGYRRAEVTAYAPALSDYSIAYNRYDSELQNAVTLYFYRRPGNAASELPAEEQEIVRAHSAVSFVSRRSVALEAQGASYDASLVTFEYTEVFAGRRQRVSSQLVLVDRPGGLFMVRSTAPVAQAAAAERAMLQLIDSVGWRGEP